MPTASSIRRLSTLEILIRYAVRAPSAHNAQPWRFVTDGASRILVFADRTRQLPVGDADGRELIVSCGAALENLTVAARAFGFEPEVRLRPDPQSRDLLAAVTVVPGDWPTDAEGLLFDAIERRHTTREHFAPLSIDAWLVQELMAAAASRGARLIPLQGRSARALLKALVQEGDRRLFANPVWRRELASWIRTPRAGGDGVALPHLPAFLARTAIRATDVGVRASVSDALFVERAPLIAVLATLDDGVDTWLAAGRALERVLLSAACEGVQAGFLNQPCQLPDLRAQLGAIIGGDHPQVVLRFGHPTCVLRVTPRRPVEAIAEMT